MHNLRKEAMGRMCTVQRWNICNKDPETSCLAHLNVPGLNTKAHDLHACIACSSCHEWLDHGYTSQDISKCERDLEHLEAIIRTQKIWIDEGFV